MAARSSSTAVQRPHGGFFDPAACPRELPAGSQAFLPACRHAWKRFGWRFSSAAAELSSALGFLRWP
eukprot:5691925-Pyramimonas_sp.AAC.1